MKTKSFLIPLAAASVLAATALPAAAHPAAHAAAPWTSVGQRQAMLDRRIDQGVRDHSLTRAEARRLRYELTRIERLENHYRRDGLSRWEMADLDRRMDALNRQIRVQRHDEDRRYGYGYGEGRYDDHRRDDAGYGYGYGYGYRR